MERHGHAKTKRQSILLLLLLVIFGLFGCNHKGRMVPAEERVLLHDSGSGQGTFNTDGLTVDYTYKLQGMDLDLAGNAYYRGGFDSLNVYVLFIDPAGNILDRKLAYYSGYRVFREWRENTFEESLAVPPGAAGFSFSYSAQPSYIKR